MVKRLLTILLCIHAEEVFSQHQRLSYFVSESCDTLTGFFYLNIGRIESNIFYSHEFNHSALRGLYFEKESIFDPDTIYCILDKKSSFFNLILDSIGVKYKLFDRCENVLDSIKSIYHKSEANLFKRKMNLNRDRAVFIKMKMKLFLNNSFIKESPVTYKFCFTKTSEITDNFNNCDFLYYKPILSFEILTPPTFCFRTFNYLRNFPPP